jgi:hypothetical protein
LRCSAGDLFSSPVKGKSGNPGGLTKEYAQELRRNAPKVAAELLRIALHAERESDRVAACRAYLDRAWGVMQLLGDDDANKKTTIEVRFVRPDPRPLPPLDHPRRPWSRRIVCQRQTQSPRLHHYRRESPALAVMTERTASVTVAAGSIWMLTG